MTMLRRTGFLLCTLLALSFQCSAASPCKHGDLESFKTAWKTYLDESISSIPEKIANLYAFPLNITEGTQFGEDFDISRDSFIKNYDVIFRGQLKDGKANSSLVDGFKVAPEVGKMDDFGADGCSYSGRTEWGSIYFKWSENGRWLAYSVEHDQVKRLQKKMK